MEKVISNRHRIIQPKILYFGTPVALINTLNEDGTTNISPISSAWALGDNLVLGLGLGGQAIANLRRVPECTVNLPDPSMWQHVEKLALLTGSDPVPEGKLAYGCRHEKDKYGAAGLTPMESSKVRPSRIRECPIQIEALVQHIRVPEHTPTYAIVEVQSILVHAVDGILASENHIDPERWSPLIYNFRHYYGLGEQLGKNVRSET